MFAHHGSDNICFERKLLKMAAVVDCDQQVDHIMLKMKLTVSK